MKNLDQYDYQLPQELIAQFPLQNRVDARLMVIDRENKSITHEHVRNLPELFNSSDTLVINETRVIPARLIGIRTQTGGRWEGLFLDLNEEGHWRLLCKTRGKLIVGDSITLLDSKMNEDIHLRLIEKQEEGIWLAHPETEEETLSILDRLGRVPLPHYIRSGAMNPSDKLTYQTVYAKTPGAVAAPTAGLHFTENLLNEIQQAGVMLQRVTLHIGMGTFRPIKVGDLSQHKMHSERGQIDEQTASLINQRRAAGGRIISVGTTTVRVLETAAQSGTLQPWQGSTELFIRPPYRFNAVDGLITNFHLPRSTLLVMVSTFCGHRLIRQAYQEAIDQQYRFYSYGDAMIII